MIDSFFINKVIHSPLSMSQGRGGQDRVGPSLCLGKKRGGEYKLQGKSELVCRNEVLVQYDRVLARKKIMVIGKERTCNTIITW